MVGPDRKKSPFLQVITPEGSHFLPYPPEEYRADSGRCMVRLGENFFSRSGIRISIHRDGLQMDGNIAYSHPIPIQRDLLFPTLMGPFSHVPGLECRHDVWSMNHRLSGVLNLNGRTLDFTGGNGYLETDEGRSFPSAWVWYQSCRFPDPEDSVMFAAARVPYAGISFPGLLCVCHAGGVEHRIATYLGGRLTHFEMEKGIALLEARQGGYLLRIRVLCQNPQKLLAPSSDGSWHSLREYPCCRSRVLLKKDGRFLLDAEGGCAGFEQYGRIRK